MINFTLLSDKSIGHLVLVKSLNSNFKSKPFNEVPPFGVISETAGGTNPYFATGAGGMLQAVLSGFGGLKISAKGITQEGQPKLPAGWNELIIKGVGVQNKTYSIK